MTVDVGEGFEWDERCIDSGGGVTDTVRYSYVPLCKDCGGDVLFKHDRMDYVCDNCDAVWNELKTDA
jgi:DNA-directed RNA polymerase subunit RPC12/RpoP